MRQVEVLNTMYLEIVKNIEMAKITLLDNTPIINILDRPVFPLPSDNISTFFLCFFFGFIGLFLSLIYYMFRKFITDALV